MPLIEGMGLAKWLACRWLEKITFEANRTRASGVLRLVGDDVIVHVIMPRHNAQ